MPDQDRGPELPEFLDRRNMARTAIHVLSHGLPSLPEQLTYQMAIPVAYWPASRCAVVLFLAHCRH